MSDMTLQTHLYRRNSTYYFRAKIPVDLQACLGKSEEKYSLKTRDPEQARRLARQASVAFDERCEQARAALRCRTERPGVTLDDALIRDICALWRYHALAGDEATRREALFEDCEEEHATRQATRAALTSALQHNNVKQIEPALRTFLHLLGIELQAGDPQYRKLLYRFLQTATEVHDLQLARDDGEVVWTPEPPITHVPMAGTEPKGPTLDELFAAWQRFNPSRPKRTVDDVRRALAPFKALVGNKAACAIERQDIVAYRDALIAQGLRAKTVEKKLAFLCALFNVGIDSGTLTANPAQRIAMPKGDGGTRLPFDLDDLQRLFASPLYAGQAALGRGIGAAGLWLPLLALYQGCRVEELAQLLVADVQRIDGIDCLIIDDLAGTMSGTDGTKHLKNAASRRRLPLHPALIEAGFLGYIEALRGRGEEQVFPDLKPDRYGKRSAAFSKAFMKYLRNELGIRDRRKVFHSFRHTFRDACREAGLDEEMADALMGHSGNQKTGRRYGRGFSLRRLRAALDKVGYPGLTVPQLPADTIEFKRRPHHVGGGRRGLAEPE